MFSTPPTPVVVGDKLHSVVIGPPKRDVRCTVMCVCVTITRVMHMNTNTRKHTHLGPAAFRNMMSRVYAWLLGTHRKSERSGPGQRSCLPAQVLTALQRLSLTLVCGWRAWWAAQVGAVGGRGVMWRVWVLKIGEEGTISDKALISFCKFEVFLSILVKHHLVFSGQN